MPAGWVLGLVISFVLGTRVQIMASKKEDNEDAADDADQGGTPKEATKLAPHIQAGRLQTWSKPLHIEQLSESDCRSTPDNGVADVAGTSEGTRESPVLIRTKSRLQRRSEPHIKSDSEFQQAKRRDSFSCSETHREVLHKAAGYIEAAIINLTATEVRTPRAGAWQVAWSLRRQ